MAYITVYTGPMFSGKTLQLLVAGEREEIAGNKVLAFKSSMDNRFGENVIKSRKGYSREAINISDISELKNYDADVYLIDEFQFLNGDVSLICDMADAGKRFYIAGLNLTAEKNPFGLMPQILCMADKIEFLTAVCTQCKSHDGVYTKYKLGKKDQDILVGDDVYTAVCRKCMAE